MSRPEVGRADQERWSIRPAEENDMPAIVDLLNDVYGGWGRPATWRWKYNDPPAAFRSPSAVAESGGEIIGHFGIQPVEAIWNGRNIRAGQTIDAAVRPDFRRQGIHSKLGGLVLEAAAQANISLIYAFPGLFSINVDRRIGYRRVAFLPEVVRLLATRQVLALALARLPGDLVVIWRMRRSREWSPETVRRLFRLRRSLLLVLAYLSDPVWPRQQRTASINVQEVDDFARFFDTFWEARSPDSILGLQKNSRYLSWRYGDHPDRRYQTLAAFSARRLLGFCVLGHRPPYSYMCELLADPGRDDVIDALAMAAGRQARQEGCLVQIGWARPGQAGSDRLHRLGFISMGRLHQLAKRLTGLNGRFYQVVVHANHLQPDDRQQLIRATDQWPLALGDSDLA